PLSSPPTTPSSQIPTLSLHDALPILAADAINGTVWFDFTRGGGGVPGQIDDSDLALPGVVVHALRDGEVVAEATSDDQGLFTLRSEEHTSELQSRFDLVCRLLLAKKK